ncbi:transcriptional regulator [Thalassotalea psychrophila]|uniref:Transcriptional regulator n=1 Tax=Thalassotalea psychrophila TaxID=3065647 RepID=A0ABY9TXT6_9GAMM|nr:transcriptional regulator [Colwelliaceae bacterium SQ149]
MAGIRLSTQEVFIFDEFKINLSKERIYKNNEEIKLEPQLFSCLALLVLESPNVVSRERIQNDVWAGRHVSDEAIRAAFKKLRKILGDDAKSPIFIKTVPRQGYKFIAPVERALKTDISNNKLLNNKFKFNHLNPYFIIVLLCLFVGFFYISYSKNTTDNDLSIPPKFEVSRITALAGSETYGSFNHNTQTISFTHRSKSDAPQQILIKNLKNNRLQKISWDGAHYSGAYWSRGGNKLAFGRSNKGLSSNIITEFNKSGDVVDVNELKHLKLKGKYVVGWHRDNALYLAQEAHISNNRSIYKFDLTTQELISVTSPQVTGSGDYLASESFDGKYLAIIREVATGEFSLLVLETGSGTLIANRIVPMFVNRIVWHQDNNTLTLSAFNGAAASFDIAKNSLRNLPEFPAYTNDIFAECGKNCYLMRQHNGNYLDIKEEPNSLLSHKTENNTPLISASDIIALSGAQDLPRYNQSGSAIYFATLTAESLMIHKQESGGNLSIKACWPSDVIISNLEISPNEKHFAVIVNQRLVIEPIKTLSECNLTSHTQPVYITDSLKKVADPVWHDENEFLYITVYENGKPNIKRFSLKDKKYTHVINDYIAYRPYYGFKGYNAVVIDKNKIAWLVFIDNKKVIKKLNLAKVESANLHRWAIDKTGLYFTSRQGRESFLINVNFNTNPEKNKGMTKVSIGNNKFRVGFDLHPNKSKLLLVESLSAQSDFVKVTW